MGLLSRNEKVWSGPDFSGVKVTWPHVTRSGLARYSSWHRWIEFKFSHSPSQVYALLEQVLAHPYRTQGVTEILYTYALPANWARLIRIWSHCWFITFRIIWSDFCYAPAFLLWCRITLPWHTPSWAISVALYKPIPRGVLESLHDVNAAENPGSWRINCFFLFQVSSSMCYLLPRY